ncbi:MAG: hypothetical protein CAF41_003510 [Nitrospira sp. CG24A]|nr:MAG: hypothetical protein CAF41_003510 [Nitrospira sp. CG24A]
MWQQTERIGHPTGLWAVLTAALLLPMMVLPAAATEGKRVAFVVGIGSYDNLSTDRQLKNAVNDADGVSAKLTEIGFRVTKAPNLTRQLFNVEWQKALDSLTTEDTFVLFFSGHGVQIEGENYLLPRDIPFIEYGMSEYLKRESISVNQLLDNLTMGDRQHPKRVVIILDACRDNPLVPPGMKSIKTPSGLAKPSSTEGLFVIYAAVENGVSLDRLPSDEKSVKYSVFTRTLLPLLTRQDLTLQGLSVTLKKEVSTLAKKGGRRQLPTYYDGTDGEPFCFPGCTAHVEKEPVGLKENLTTTIVRPSSPKEITDKVKVDSPPEPQSSDRTQQLAMKQNVPIPHVQPAEKLPSAITGKDDVAMALIPAGEFSMGTADDVEGETLDERPRHRVHLDAYSMDKFEVTVSRYEEFMRSTGRTAPRRWKEMKADQRSNIPVVNVDWHDAEAYCRWAGKRLPTEAEWEKAARGTDERTYPWGNQKPTSTLANSAKTFEYNMYENLAPVERYEAGKSPYGLHHMAGNVWEWTADWYDKDYYAKSPERNPTGPLSGTDKVLRGGSWVNDKFYARSALRFNHVPTFYLPFIGFRCAQDRPN